VRIPRQITASSTVLAIGGSILGERNGYYAGTAYQANGCFIPVIPLLFDGHTIDPFVSVPIATMHRFAETATPDPELDPQGLRSST